MPPSCLTRPAARKFLHRPWMKVRGPPLLHDLLARQQTTGKHPAGARVSKTINASRDRCYKDCNNFGRQYSGVGCGSAAICYKKTDVKKTSESMPARRAPQCNALKCTACVLVIYVPLVKARVYQHSQQQVI